MTAVLLTYAPIQSKETSRWVHLLQQQAVYESARVVLAGHRQSDRGILEPELSEHTLFAPAHLDILPVLAIAARDYAVFVEPEGLARPSRTPISLYVDPSWRPESDLTSMMDRLLHPAWFDAPVPLPEIVERYRPEVCVIAGDPNSIARQLRGLDHQFVQILIFESLMPRTTEMPRLPGEIVRAERLISELVEKHSSRMEDPIRRSGVWQSMLNRDEFLPDLERFLPFGLAIEIAIRGH